MKAYKKSMFVMEVEEENRNPESILVYRTLNGALIRVPKKAWSLFDRDSFQIEDDSVRDFLVGQGFVLPVEADETAVFDLWKDQQVHDFSTVKSKILATRRCNLACVYCILDPEPKVMTPETARKMDRFYLELIRRKNPSLVVDNYLGGEPLTNPGAILESASRRYHFCSGKGIEYRFSVTTNGTLIARETVERMIDSGLASIGVSIAGPAPIHDRLRPFKSGKGTYGTIMDNLKKISGLVPISIECQYDSASEDYLRIPEMMDELASEGIFAERISFTPILPRRGRNLFRSGFERPEIGLFLNREAAERGFPVYETPPSTACMADFRSHLVFDTDGSIVPCPSLQGGEMAYGHVDTGIDFAEEARSIRRNLPAECRSCPLLPNCRGGCRLQALARCGNFNGVDCHRDALTAHMREYILRKGGLSS